MPFPPAAVPSRRGLQCVAAEETLPCEVWEHVFSFLSSDPDRNAVSIVCRMFHRIDRFSRTKIFIPNCYAAKPSAVFSRFPNVRRLWIKGKPHFADFNLVPDGWGGSAMEWVRVLVECCPMLVELRFKRMVVTDECLEIVAKGFKGFQNLGLVSCEGFTCRGLAAIASNCRSLKELDLTENEMDDNAGNWLGSFPETSTSLVSLNFFSLDGEVNASILEQLVTRCKNLKTLRFNRSVCLNRLAKILKLAPQLVDLGTGKLSADPQPELYSELKSAFSACKGLKALSGIWQPSSFYLPAVYTVGNVLETLNLSYTCIESSEFVKLIKCCPNVRKLWVLDFVEDEGLEAVASSCRLLQELRVFPSDSHLYGVVHPISLTERGLVAVSAGCPMLHSILYFCHQMTNAALLAIAKNQPNFTRFRLCVIEPHAPDYVTQQPLDAGFSAIVKSCKSLRRLSVSGLLTDRVFKSIGKHADNLEMLSIAFAGDSDAGLHYILSGCKSLRKLEIRDCPFGDKALLANAAKLETMRSLWMSSCSVSLGACKLLAQRMPRLNVEVINEDAGPRERWPEDGYVEKVYIYRSLAGPRTDAPNYVWTV